MLFYVAKNGAVLSNGKILYPGNIVDNTPKNDNSRVFDYKVYNTLQDKKLGNYEEFSSTLEEFDFLYRNKILCEIENISPLTKPKFTIGQLVKTVNSNSIGIIMGKYYDYDTLEWKYQKGEVDVIRDTIRGTITVSVITKNNFWENELTPTQNGQTEFELNNNIYDVKYEMVKGV